MPFSEFGSLANANNIASQRVKQIRNMVNSTKKNEEPLDKIDTMSFEDIINYLNCICDDIMKYDDHKICTSCDSIIDKVDSSDSCGDETKDIIGNKLLIIANKLNNKSCENIDKLFNAGYKYVYPGVNLIHVNNRDLYEITKSATNESIVIIKSMNNYTQTVNYPQLTDVKMSPQEIANILVGMPTQDRIVSNLDLVMKYYEAIKENPNIYADDFRCFLQFIIEHMRSNYTGLVRLKEIIEDIIKDIEDVNNLTILASEGLYEIRQMLYEERNVIDGIINVSEGKGLSMNIEPFVEMGIGKIADVLTYLDYDNEDERAIITEAIESVDVRSLNESLLSQIRQDASEKSKFKNERKIERFKQRIEKRDEYRDRLRDMKYENKIRKQEDKYENARQRKKDRQEDRYEAKRQKQEDKKQRNEEIKRQKAVDKAEAKTWTNTNKTGRYFKNLRRNIASGAAAAGASALLGINPLLGAGLYLGRKNMRRALHPAGAKMQEMQDIENQLVEIESQIDQAKEDNDREAEVRLTKMRNKLKNTYERYAYTLGRGERG